MNATNLHTTLAVTTLVGIAHIVCGIAAIYVPNVLNVAPLSGLHQLGEYLSWPQQSEGFLLLLVGALAVIASQLQFAMRVLLLIPQQLVLLLQIWSISTALVTGHYPDGYIPAGGPWFILTDQIWAWILIISHSLWLAAYIYQGARGDGRTG
jgi:hypothetical protein